MKKLYKYTLTEPYTTKLVELENVYYYGKWGYIYDGRIVIYTGYSWDGCSIKLFKLGKYYIGTPDGWFDGLKYRKDWTKEASLVHDFLYQFHEDILITRLTADNCFRYLLKKVKFPLWKLYYNAVRKFGKIYWK